LRFVNPIRVDEAAPGEWLRLAKDLREELDAAPDAAARRRIISDKAECWRDAKKFLKPILNRKCWYCETEQERSDNPIDHYRPKSMYWWLAFELSNFRFCCTYCNSRREDPESDLRGGKQDLFPLKDESMRAKTPDEVEDEEPLLLDPCVYEDHKRLWFDETGLSRLHPRYVGDDFEEARFKTSRELYNLDFDRLQTARRLKYLEVTPICREGDSFWRRYNESQDREFLAEFSKRVVRVVRLIDYMEEHSAAAWHATLGLRTKSVTAQHALGIEE
jgi:uncharacterized protein (TIGR02646 family)